MGKEVGSRQTEGYKRVGDKEKVWEMDIGGTRI
jgi:hypothetical protein